MLIVVLPLVTFSIMVSEEAIYVKAPPLMSARFSKDDVEDVDLSSTPQLHIRWRTWAVAF